MTQKEQELETMLAKLNADERRCYLAALRTMQRIDREQSAENQIMRQGEDQEPQPE